MFPDMRLNEDARKKHIVAKRSWEPTWLFEC